MLYVSVYVRPRHPLRVQESLKQQVEPDGVHVCDSHAERKQAAGSGAAARANVDIDASSVVDEIPDDEKIGFEAHLLNNAHFIIVPFKVHGVLVLRLSLEPLVKSRFADVLEILHRGGERGGNFVIGQIHIAHFDSDVALVRDAECVVQGLGEVAEQLLHLLGRVQVVSGTLVPAMGHVDGYILFQAHHDLVGVGILLAEVVRVRCGHDGNVQLPGQAQQLRVDQLLILDAVPLDFNIEILSENVQELLRGIVGALPVPVRKGFWDKATQAGGSADDAFVVLL